VLPPSWQNSARYVGQQPPVSRPLNNTNPPPHRDGLAQTSKEPD